jgi:hypothetical protein
VVAGVAGAQVADHLGGALAAGKARFGLTAKLRPGIGARPARVRDGVSQALEVDLQGFGAPAVKAPGRTPEVHQAGDDVAPGAADEELVRAMLGAEMA